MIKSWEKFNEAVKYTLHFVESEEFEEVLNKYAYSKKDIKNFFTDLEDDRDIETNLIRCYAVDISNDNFKIIVTLAFKKSYKKPPRNSNNVQTGDYLKFLSEQVEDIKSIEESCKHFAEVEHLKFIVNEVYQEPFQGAGANTEEYGHLGMWISYEKIIETNEMIEAKIRFQKKDNPYKKALNKIAEKLVEYGIKKEHAIKLLDINPGNEEMDDVDVGFLSNDEIISIAYITKSFKDIEYLEDEILDAVGAYESGYCSDILGDNYL